MGIYSLKQFAHVIQGNPNAQGRTAMGSPLPIGICYPAKGDLHKKKPVYDWIINMVCRGKFYHVDGRRNFRIPMRDSLFHDFYPNINGSGL
jgi:hypothetical protein